MENLERTLVRKIQHHRDMADHYRRRAVDLMTWKQFQEFNPSGIYRGRSKRIKSLLEFSQDERNQCLAVKRRLDALLSFEVIQGGKHPWCPSSPIASLHEVAQ